MSNWQDITKLVRKIDHPVIVMDDPDTLVVMKLSEYDRLISVKSEMTSLSEEEFLNRINRQIALWRASQGEAVSSDFSDQSEEPIGTNATTIDTKGDEDTFYIEPLA